MISVEDALAQCLSLVRPLDCEAVALEAALGRVLAEDIIAPRDQPPFIASAMDGYAITDQDHQIGTELDVIGEAPAGRAWGGRLAAGQALRIFTGAPLPEGAMRVVIQEDVTRLDDGARIRINATDPTRNIRPAGADFKAGFRMTAPRRLLPNDILLAAAMNHPKLVVRRRPQIALIATGDELVPPGGTPRPDQIIAANTYGLAALVEAQGAQARLLPIARDDAGHLGAIFDMAQGADLIVTIGGASVGDHDLVAQVARARGLDPAFHKIAMRPGKPLMAGRMGQSAFLGLPGNPVSAMVCAHLFLVPMIAACLGLPPPPSATGQARLGVDLPQNGPRAHYMRATLAETGAALPVITPFPNQDSALVSVLAQAGALLIRPPHDGAKTAGAVMEYLKL